MEKNCFLNRIQQEKSLPNNENLFSGIFFRRPVFSMVNAYIFYDLKFLVNLLTHLCNSPYAVEDSFSFAHEIQGFIYKNLFMASFYVVSLLLILHLMKLLALLKISCTTVLTLNTMDYAEKIKEVA